MRTTVTKGSPVSGTRSPVAARALLHVVAAALLALAWSPHAAHAGSFLAQVERGKAAVLASTSAASGDAAARAAAVEEAVRTSGGGSSAFALGAALAALNLDLEDDPSHTRRGDRAAVERQVRMLLRAQADTGIGNRALCLLSGRTNPRSLEAQIRLVEPRWTCGPQDHH